MAEVLECHRAMVYQFYEFYVDFNSLMPVNDGL
jgi:hypothetical protein